MPAVAFEIVVAVAAPVVVVPAFVAVVDEGVVAKAVSVVAVVGAGGTATAVVATRFAFVVGTARKAGFSADFVVEEASEVVAFVVVVESASVAVGHSQYYCHPMIGMLAKYH